MTRIAFGLDDTGDWDFNPDTGVFNMISDNEALTQKLSLLLGENLGEIPWNEDLGLDHNELIANGDDQEVVQTILDDYLTEQWTDIYDSLEITEFKVDRLNRLTELSANVTLVDGTVISASVNEQQGDDEDATDE